MTFDEVKAQKTEFINSFEIWPDWLKGVGVGTDPLNDNAPILKINVKDAEDILKLHKHITENMPELILYRIDIVGEIVAL